MDRARLCTSKAKTSDERRMNQIPRCVVHSSGGTSPPLPTFDRMVRICFFVALAFACLLLKLFLLRFAKSPADMLPQISNTATVWSVGRVAPQAPLEVARSSQCQVRDAHLNPKPPDPYRSEAAPSPRDACLRITLDAKSPYSNIHAPVLRLYLPILHSRRAACISHHDIPLPSIVFRIGGYVHLSFTDPLVGLFHAPA